MEVSGQVIIAENDRVLLRDLVESDLEKRLYWEAEETEWQLWDGPWDYEGKSPQELEEEREDYLSGLRRRVEQPLPDDATRWSFQIVEKATGVYVGWVNSYFIDDDCSIDDSGHKLALGLDLPDPASRGRGLGTAALGLVIQYFFARGYTELYTQTWSGNLPMQALAAKLGFREYRRKPGLRLVRGERYDGLTFRLERDSH